MEHKCLKWRENIPFNRNEGMKVIFVANQLSTCDKGICASGREFVDGECSHTGVSV